MSARADGAGVQHGRLSLLASLFEFRRGLAVVVRRLADAGKRGSVVGHMANHGVNGGRGGWRRFHSSLRPSGLRFGCD